MYHFALALTVLVPASLIALARPADHQFLAIGENRVDAEKEHHGEAHHDENHRRGEPGLLPGGPGDLGNLAPDLAEERQRSRAPAHRRRQILARRVCRLFRRVRHVFSSFNPLVLLAGVEGLEPTAYGFGDRRSTN